MGIYINAAGDKGTNIILIREKFQRPKCSSFPRLDQFPEMYSPYQDFSIP